MSQDTALGEGQSRWPSTSWDVLTRIVESGSSVREMEELAGRYWRPVYRFIRSVWKKSNEDAKDLTQEFFATIFDVEFLRRADPDRGNFRKFVLASLRNFLNNAHRTERTQKRGGGRNILSLDARVTEDLEELSVTSSDPDSAFNEAWAAEIMRRATADLESEYEGAGKSARFEVFRKYYLSPERATGSYREIAEQSGMTPAEVHNHLVAARRDLRRLCVRILTETVRDPSEMEGELALLLGRSP